MKKIFVLLSFLFSSFAYEGGTYVTANLKDIKKIDSGTYELTFRNLHACETYTLTVSYSYKKYMNDKLEGIYSVGYPNRIAFTINMNKLRKQIGKDITMELIGASYWEYLPQKKCYAKANMIKLAK